jgi:hypothetical protein
MSDQNRDLYQWDGSDAGQPAQPQGDGGATSRFRDEAYQPQSRYSYQPQPPAYPREYHMPARGGGDNVNMVVYGDVYINQGGSDNCYRCRRRADGRDEYYGRGYYYQQYCQPRYEALPYYGYHQPQYPQYYDRSNYYRQAPEYSRDSVRGGPGGYSADRERYRGGYERYGGQPYYNGGCFGGGGYGGDSYPSDWDRAGQVFDFALRGFDTWAGYDIARRHAKGQYSDRGGYHGGGGYYGGGGGDRYAAWRQYRQQQAMYGRRGY